MGINAAGNRPARSNPMNMPLPGGNGARSAIPVLIESGSCSMFFLIRIFFLLFFNFL